ncbi:MAG TPA: sulfate adenylyltransferase subunit CysN [bacterium]|nr:sulfate adenylyltransferase subunit CysN [bacterium]
MEVFLEAERAKDLLRFSTAGSVDDGKSTLIGRLLYDSKGVFEDQLDAIRRTTEKKGGEDIDFALITDGLSAEREQGITIDVAYRYFVTAKRKFIIADTPGHEQYTRNMVTGASTADLAIILIDARNGVLIQSKRHGYIAKLLGIPHLVVAVNKMDLVDFSQEVFERIKKDYTDFFSQLVAENPAAPSLQNLEFIPLSALKGDNVTVKSPAMPWYGGKSLLQYLETVEIARDRNLDDFRFPVQLVLRPNLDYRGFAGKVVSGVAKKGQKVVTLPSGAVSTLKAIDTFDGERDEAWPPACVTLRLADEIDISRGDMLALPGNEPKCEKQFEANLCWMVKEPMALKKKYVLKLATGEVKAMVSAIRWVRDMRTLDKVEAQTLALNDIARVVVQTLKPICFDPYARNRATGSFILIDELTNNTVAAGMITE